MHIIQEKLLQLSNRANLAQMSLRKMAEGIGRPEESPQKIKHHLQQLEKKGFLTIDRSKGTMEKAKNVPSWARGLLRRSNQLFAIPLIGTANCGPATIFAEQNFAGFLRVSSRLVGRARPHGLYAIKADGHSMNRAEIDGRNIDDGDYIIIDGMAKNVRTGDIVLAIVDGKATVKRFIRDTINGQIVLTAESSYDYDPIYIHEDDQFDISGKAIGIIKKPVIHK